MVKSSSSDFRCWGAMGMGKFYGNGDEDGKFFVGMENFLRDGDEKNLTGMAGMETI